MFKESEQIEKFEPKVWLSSPTMHGEEIKYVQEAYETNWMSTVGANINEVERLVCKKIGCKYAVGLSAGTAALHMAVKLAGVKPGEKVFCSDMTFSATVNPIVYEGGVPVFIDTEYDTWNMDPEALEKAFELYPDVKVVVIAHLYGTPGKVDELRDICEKHGAVIIEDAAESMGATYKGLQTGTFGKYNAISFNGNKIITGSSGGILLTDDKEAAEKARKWSTQSREAAPWYQHEEIGYNYRMSNVIAGVVRGQMPHLEEHIAQKKAIYERYKEGLKGLPVRMNPYNEKESEPNFWLSCLILDKEAMCRQVRSECEPLYIPETGKSCPNNGEYAVRWKKRMDIVHFPELGFTNLAVIKEFCKTIPDNSLLHTTVLDSIRMSNYVEMKPSIRCFANIGADGIDGALSTYLGQGESEEKPVYLLIGDLSLMYDMNALLQKLPHNIRIVVINNYSGAEFHKNFGLDRIPTLNKHIAAGHRVKIANCCINFQFKYLAATNMEEVREALTVLNTESEKPILLEVFTDADKDAKILKSYWMTNRQEIPGMKLSGKARVKQIVRNILGNKAYAIREMFKK